MVKITLLLIMHQHRDTYPQTQCLACSVFGCSWFWLWSPFWQGVKLCKRSFPEAISVTHTWHPGASRRHFSPLLFHSSSAAPLIAGQRAMLCFYPGHVTQNLWFIVFQCFKAFSLPIKGDQTAKCHFECFPAYTPRHALWLEGKINVFMVAAKSYLSQPLSGRTLCLS